MTTTPEYRLKHDTKDGYDLRKIADTQASGAATLTDEQREEVEAVIACLGDDAASLRDENPEDERAANMDRAAELLEALSTATAPSAPARPSMRDELQKKCSDWGTYWRASDAHGVELTKPQAIELLQDALGVEVELKDNGCETCDGVGMIGGPSFYEPGEGGVPCPDCTPKARAVTEAAGDAAAIRMAFLHSANRDADGYEWGVGKVRFGADGKVDSFLWGASDSSDLDAAMSIHLRPDVLEAEAAAGGVLACGGAPTSSVAVAPSAEPLQPRVRPWLVECFGKMIAGDREERNHRFIEEALELVQACGCSASEAHQLVDYVFSRPIGEKGQEVGGTMITLAALCLANDLDMHVEGERELARITQPEMVLKIRAKQAAKPKHSPLPIAPPAAAVPARLSEFPAMTDELASILGTMCFQCITSAQALRAAGHQIKSRAEDEQAAVLHWMLGHYFRHGAEGWRKAAVEDMQRMRDASRSAGEVQP